MWGQLDKISGTLIGITAVACMGILFCFMFISIECGGNWDDTSAQRVFGIGKKLAAVALLSGLLAAFIPSSNTVAMMVVIPKIANSEAIQRDLPDVYRAAVDALKEQLKTKKP